MKNESGKVTRTRVREYKWVDIKKEIERRIIVGEFQAGAKLPTIAELVEQYHIGRTTIQRALDSLESEGTIHTRRAVGCFVKPYVRARLVAEHKKEVLALFKTAAARGRVIGLNENEMRTLSEKAIKESVSTNSHGESGGKGNV
jgi:GntR family transcriptional regulator